MTEYCPRCGGELTEMPTNHYAKKIAVRDVMNRWHER